MQRAARTNLILLAVVALLGIGVWLQVRHEVDQFEPPLSAIDPGAVQTLEVRCLHCTARVFERVNGQWQMRAPYALAADATKVERLLAIAGSAVRNRRPLAELDATKIGLAPPLMSLRIDAQALDFGMTDAFNSDRYVRSDDVIAMVPDRFSPYLLATPESELDPHLLPPGRTPTALVIDGKQSMARAAAWSAARATAISARAGASTPANAVSVEIRLDDGTTIHYRLSHAEGSVIAHREQPALDYTLDATQAEALLAEPDAP